MRYAVLALGLVLAPVVSGAEPPFPRPRRDRGLLDARRRRIHGGALGRRGEGNPLRGDLERAGRRLDDGDVAPLGREEGEGLRVPDDGRGGGKVAFRLRHFDRRGVAWEEKDKPLVLPLVVKGANLAVFEGDGKSGILRLTYRREGEVLVGRLEKAGEAPVDYRFRRAPQEAGTGSEKP